MQHDAAVAGEAMGFFPLFLQSCVACGAVANFMSTYWVPLCFQREKSVLKPGKAWKLSRFCFSSVEKAASVV